jgi:hypothetical protein
MGSITNSMIFVILVSKNVELPPPAEPSNVGGSLFFFRQSVRLVVNKTDKYTSVYIYIQIKICKQPTLAQGCLIKQPTLAQGCLIKVDLCVTFSVFQYDHAANVPC